MRFINFCLCLVLLFSESSFGQESLALVPVDKQTILIGRLSEIQLKTTTEDSTTVFISSQLPEGACLDQKTGFLSWTPSFNQIGEFSIPITATNSINQTDSTNLVIEVISQTPNIHDIGDKEVRVGCALSFQITADDDDTSSLLFSCLNIPTNAVLNPITGLFSWSPDTSQKGVYQLVFEVKDSHNNIDSTHAIIIVNEESFPPQLRVFYKNEEISQIEVNEGEEVILLLDVDDRNRSDSHVFSFLRIPDDAEWNEYCNYLSWKPEEDDCGLNNLIFKVTDSQNESDVKSVSITVNDIQHDPVLYPISDRTINEGETLEFTITATDKDNDIIDVQVEGQLPGDYEM